MMRWISALCLLLSGPAYGASFYISTTGSDTNGCTNSTTDACASFPRCCSVMAAGDTCYATDGTYTTTGTNGWEFTCNGGTAGNTKKFTSLSQDASKVTIAAANPTTQNTWFLKGVEGTNTAQYLEFSYLTFSGRGEANYGGDGISIHHNVLKCPNTGTGGGNQPMMNFRATYTRRATGLSIYENYFLLDDSCPAFGTGNMEMLVTYYTDGAIIEKNDFVNASTTRTLYGGFLPKRGNKDDIYQYNYFRLRPSDGEALWIGDCDGDWVCGEYGTDSCEIKVRYNIFVNESTQSTTDCTERNWWYNNTIVNYDTRCIAVRSNSTAVAAGGGNRVFNNICYRSVATAGEVLALPAYGSVTWGCMDEQDYIDNNIYYPLSTSSSGFRDCGGYGTGSLTTWQSHLLSTGHEQASRSVDPLFVDAGTGDYHLQGGSPALSGGRGGAYPSVIGAYVTGTEQIGCSFSPGCYSYGATTAVFGNIRRVDLKGVSVK